MSQAHSPTRYARIETRNLKHSPNCVFYVNGDGCFPGHKLCISNRIRTFDGVKDDLTKSLFTKRQQVGSVRNIFTPTHGHRINSIDELEDGQHYVAAVNDRFLPLPYREIPEKTRVPRHKGFKKIDINKIYTPVQHAFEERLRKKSGRSYYLNEQVRGLILRVHVNGFNERPACPVSIRSKDKDNMTKIKEGIEDIVGCLPIEKIYHIINCGGYIENFVEIHDPSELEHNGHILVLPKHDRKLQPLFYSLGGKHNFTVATSPRSGQYYLYPSFPSETKQYKHNQSPYKHKPLPSIGSSGKQSDAVSPFSNPPSHHGRGGRRSKGRAQNVDYDKDEGGVYRAKGQNNARGAQQVKDTYETQTERPIDQMEAEEVDEERIHAEKGTPIPPGTELNKQPSEERKQSEKGTHAKDAIKEVNTDDSSKEVGRTDSTTYRVRTQSPEEYNKDITIKDDERVTSRDQYTIVDQHGEETDKQYQSKETDPMKDQTKDLVNNNDKGQTAGDWDREETPKQENVENDNVVQNQEQSPDKRSTGSQVYTPPNQIREEERTNEDQGIHRIDEFEDESFGAADDYGGNSSLNKSHTNNPMVSTPQSRTESRRKQRENEAATRIQAGAKGYQARKEHKRRAETEQRGREAEREMKDTGRHEEDEFRKKQDEAASKIQAGYKGYKYRKEMNAKKAQVSDQDSLDVARNENNAAIKIQAGYRGYKTRKDFNTRKTFSKKGEPEKSFSQDGEIIKQQETEAATKIQAGYRGYKVRKDRQLKQSDDSVKYDKQLSEEKAAVKIQAGYRGYKTRRAYASNKEARKVMDELMTDEKDDNAYSDRHQSAATKIQAGYKGYRARKNYASMKSAKVQGVSQEEAAATKIQAGYRGYQTRKRLNEQKNMKQVNGTDAREEAAATKIQAGFRGFKTRKELKSKVKEGNKERKGLEAEKLPDSILSLETPGSITGLNAGSSKDIVSKLQSAFNGFKARKHYSKKLKKTYSALKIQAAYKGYKVRLTKGFTSRNFEFDEFKKYKAAMKIISVFNGYLERRNNIRHRNKVIETKTENISKSSWIQNSEVETTFRHTPQGPSYVGSGKSYWEDSNVKMYSDDLRNQAATKLQSAFFSFFTRKKYYAWKTRQSKKMNAAKKILRCFKGYFVRKEKFKSDKKQKDSEEFASVEEPKSAVEIYGTENCALDLHLSSCNLDGKLLKDISDKDSSFTEDKISSETYEREKSVGYETVISISGEVEKEGDSIKEVEDEAGEISVIEKHVNAVACLQAAVRAFKIRKEFQELLTGGGELIDIAKVDRAVSALRKEFRYKSAKVRRLAAHQFESSQESRNWWDVERTGTTYTVSLAPDSKMDIAACRANGIMKDQHLHTDHYRIQNQTDSLEGLQHKKYVTLIQAAFKGSIFRRRFFKTKISSNKHQKEYRKCVSVSETRKTNVNIKNAASEYMVIQYAARGFLHRKHLSEKNKRRKGTIIQCAARGYLERSYFTAEKKTLLAKDKISAVFKGYMVRKTSATDKAQMKSAETPGAQKKCASKEEPENDNYLKNHKGIVKQAAAKGHLKRISSSPKDLKKSKAYCAIQAAVKGHLVRQKSKANRNVYSLHETKVSDTTYTTEENVDIIHSSCSKLQAAFAAYQTRKVFISLTKLVNDGDLSDVSGQKLERMGSLSETDDFKLKHKSIAKIQTALEEHRQRNLSGMTIAVNGNYPSLLESRDFLRTRNPARRSQLSPIKTMSNVSYAKEVNTKKTTQIPIPVKQGNRLRGNNLRREKVSRIETYIKLNIAASILQASLRGHMSRTVFKKLKRAKTTKAKNSVSAKSVQNSTMRNELLKTKNGNQAEKDIIRSRTASVKLEAERRKEIRTRDAAKESTHVVKSKAEKLKAEKENKFKSDLDSVGKLVKVDDSLAQDKTSSDSMKDRVNVKGEVRNFNQEYEIWKQERISAAVMIQAGWRGYHARRVMVRQQANIDGNYEDLNQPQKLIIINIGRSKSEIARSEQRYINASLIQTIYRTCKVRRKFKIKMAVKRYERNQAVTKIQAYYRSYATRKYVEERKIASRIQAALKGNMVRKSNEAEKVLQKRNAVCLVRSTWHSFKRRKQNEAEKHMKKRQAEMNCASLVIQAVYRGFRERRDLLKKKLEIQKLAASRIQVLVKGSLYRRLIKEKRLSATRIKAAYRSYKVRHDLHLYKKNQKARKMAAADIVSFYKAHLKRKEMRLYKEKITKENKAADYVHSSIKGLQARTNEKLRRKQNYSAIKIQSVYRGYLGRKMARVLKNEKIRREILYRKQCVAAIKIQSVYRGHIGRKAARYKRYKQLLHQTCTELIENLLGRTFSYLEQKSLAAVRLQCSVRGHASRMRNEVEKEKREKIAIEKKNKVDAVASVIQIAVRAKQHRIQAFEAYKLKKKHIAATKIQAQYRGFSVRQGLEKEKARLAKLSPPVLSPDPTEMLKNARAIIAFHRNATLLQAAHRAYLMRNQTRKRFSRKINIVAITPRRENSGRLFTHEDKAAIIIQKIVRGYSDRKTYDNLIKEKRKKDSKAANMLRASINGFIARRQQKILRDKIDREGSPEVRKQKYIAACVIASAFRGYQKRKRKMALRVEM